MAGIAIARAGHTAESYTDAQEAHRLARALEQLGDVAESEQLEVPPPVTNVERLHTGPAPKMPADAYELARQVYYLQHGTLSDAARAILNAGLAPDTDKLVVVYGRLQAWWAREGWSKRDTATTFAIRDANFDGGLFRSARRCKGVTSGKTRAPKGKPCGQNAMADSDYCHQHDPRPEWVQRRREAGEAFTRIRRVDMVPVEPFALWLREQGARLIAEARADGGRIHPNERNGLSRLAHWLDVDTSLLMRAMKGAGTSTAHPREDRTIKAKTIIRYLDGSGVSFRDVYGYDPPGDGAGQYLVCPRCGGPKDHESKTCRACYDADRGERCAYVPSTGRRCRTLTKRPSGYCAKCEQTAFFVPKPKSEWTVRPSWWTVERFAYALSEYATTPSHQWVGAKMWQRNAAGVRDHYSTLKTLIQQLVREFSKRAIATPEQAAQLYAEYVAEHGDVAWPDADLPLPTEVKLVPIGPWRTWLQARVDDVGRHGAYKAVGERLTIHPDLVSLYCRGVGAGKGASPTVGRKVIERALAAWGDGTTINDLYGGEA